MKPEIEIAGLKVEPGSRSRGILEAGPYFPHLRAKIRKWVQIPFTVVNGVKDGPTLAVTGGVHGTEYAGIDAAVKLTNLINPQELCGTLLVVPVVNVLAFNERTYTCPVDGVNIQGSWPGSPNESIGQLIAYRVFDNIISKANYWIDLHGGDTHESEIDGYAAFRRIGNAIIDGKSEAMSRALGFKYISTAEGAGGKGSSQRVGPEHGIPTVLCELGTGDRLLQEESTRALKGVLNVMRYLKMLPDKPLKKEDQEFIKSMMIRVNHAGLFHSNVKLGDILQKDEIIGEVKNLYGEVLETVRAPTKGIALLILHNPVVEPGGLVILSWGILEGQPVSSRKKRFEKRRT